ncbi:MAG: hypothetical protein R3E36_10015 [Nitrosomonas sp.]|nr:hypothetical protein [Nitrosomonas sp.]
MIDDDYFAAESEKNQARNSANDLLSAENQRLFEALCQFIWTQGEPLPLILDLNEKIYTAEAITHETLRQLEFCGLIHFEPDGFVKKGLGKHTRLFYCGEPTKIGFPDAMHNQLDLGHVILTDYGKALAANIRIVRNPVFYEYVINRWFQAGYSVASIQIDRRNQRVKKR